MWSGAGCSARNAPLRPLRRSFRPTGAAVTTTAAFGAREGGVLELSGVLGGWPSRASNSATRFVSASVKAASRRIKASFSAWLRPDKSGGRIIQRLTHIQPQIARPNHEI